MRYYTDELLRRAGYGTEDRDRLRALRLALEDVLRGDGDREPAGELLAAAVAEPWFPLAYLRPSCRRPTSAGTTWTTTRSRPSRP